MKKITILLSLIVAVILILDFTNSYESLTNKVSSSTSVTLVSVTTLAQDKLALELEWIEKQTAADKLAAERLAKKNKNKVNEPKPTKNDVFSLKIGDIEYQLLGIFLSNKTPFILLKPPKGETKKIALGQEVNQGIKLARVSSNKITLEGKNESVEYNLFERSNNE